MRPRHISFSLLICHLELEEPIEHDEFAAEPGVSVSEASISEACIAQ